MSELENKNPEEVANDELESSIITLTDEETGEELYDYFVHMKEEFERGIRRFRY